MGVDLDENWVCTESTQSMVVVVALDMASSGEVLCFVYNNGDQY